jgi:hypothetical protein
MRYTRRVTIRFASIAALVGTSALAPATYHLGSAEAASPSSPSASSAQSVMWQTDATLDGIAAKAQADAGSYYANVSIDIPDDAVDVYMAGAPPSVVAAVASDSIDATTTSASGTVVTHNDAAHPLTAVQALQQEVVATVPTILSSVNIEVRHIVPTLDGHLEVGVASDIATAQQYFDSLYGAGWITVVSDNSAYGADLTYRDNDSSPWNGGDFIYHKSDSEGTASNCSAGIPVHDTSSGAEYVLTAAHCFWSYGGDGTQVRNGYVDESFNSEGSTTIIGTVAHSSDPNNNDTYDSALISASSSVVDFDCGWDCAGRNTQEGPKANHTGDPACTSGAFEGQHCSITIKNPGEDICVPGGECTADTTEGVGSGDAIAGEGDSGGPVYAYDPNNDDLQPLGMIDQGKPGDEISCPSGSPNASERTCYTTIYWIDIAGIDSHWGVTPNA